MTDPRRWTAGLRREVLPSGLTLLAQRDASAPVAAVVTHVRAGFLDEPDEWVGLSHVLEHMFFKGTPTRGVGAIARETRALGGYLNASTSYDRTSYYAVVPTRALARAVAIQADALQRATLDPDELARELRVIIEEARRKRDTPSAVAAETMHELLFDTHRIRRWRIGEEGALARFTADDLRGYYRTRYVPARTIVSIVADAPVEEILAVARAAYAGWPAADASVPAGPTEDRRTGVRVRTLRGDVAQGDLVLGWRGVPPLDPDETPLEMAAAVLSTGRGSRLYRRLRERGIATAAGAGHYSQGDVGVLAIHADGDPRRVTEILHGMADSVAALRSDGPDPGELERVRTLLRARWARQFESFEGKASAFAGAEALGGTELVDREYTRLLQVTADEVRHAAVTWLDPDAVSAVAYLPHGEGDDLDAGAVRHAFDRKAAGPRAPGAVAEVAPAAPSTTRGHTVADVLHVPLPGADLLVRRRPGTPLVTLGAYVARCEWETAENAGLAALAVRSLIRGAGPWGGAELALAAESLGGTLNPVVGSDWVGLGATVVDEQAAAGAALIQRVLAEPRYDPADVGTERSLLLEEARQMTDDMFRYPLQLASALAFGDSGYGVPVGGTPESVSRVDVADVAPWHRRNVLGARPVVIALGDAEPGRLADLLAGAFGDWPATGDRGIPARPTWQVGADGPRIQVLERDRRQTAIAMAFPGPARGDADWLAADVWASIASGLGGRLFEALRDRRSLAYTVLASAWGRAHAGALITYIATAPEREEEAREEMLRELARFVEEAPRAVEVEQGRNYRAGQREVARQSAAALAGEMLEAWFAGGGLEELDDPGSQYRAVTAEEVHAVAQRYLDPARRAEGVVRGKAG